MSENEIQTPELSEKLTNNEPIASSVVEKPAIPKFTSEQLKEISKLLFDLVKILFATIIIGYFIPSISGEVTVLKFWITLFVIIFCLTLGFSVLKYKYKVDQKY